MRDEATASVREKSSRKAPSGGKKTRAKPSGRMKLVWGIKDGAGKVVKFYAYPHKAAAEAEAARMREAGQRGCLVCPHKMPLED